MKVVSTLELNRGGSGAGKVGVTIELNRGGSGAGKVVSTLELNKHRGRLGMNILYGHII